MLRDFVPLRDIEHEILRLRDFVLRDFEIEPNFRPNLCLTEIRLLELCVHSQKAEVGDLI